MINDNKNVESLMNTFSGPTTNNLELANSDVDLDSIFPIINEEQLSNIESKIIQEPKFRNTLVSKLSLIAVASNLGLSIRRMMTRMFDDKLLISYSLIGFKKKKPFTKLMLYRILIDSLRMHIKYKMTTEKEIEVPLGVWLSHARFRMQLKKEI